MTPQGRTAWALGLSLALWAPVAMSVLNGRTDGALGGLYYLMALVLTWVGSGVVANLLEGYRQHAERVESTKRQIELLEQQSQQAPPEAEVDAPARRRSSDGDSRTPRR